MKSKDVSLLNDLDEEDRAAVRGGRVKVLEKDCYWSRILGYFTVSS